MKTLKKISKKLSSARGASMLEYALLASLISVVVIVAVTALGGQASKTFDDVAKGIGGGDVLITGTNPD